MENTAAYPPRQGGSTIPVGSIYTYTSPFIDPNDRDPIPGSRWERIGSPFRPVGTMRGDANLSMPIYAWRKVSAGLLLDASLDGYTVHLDLDPT